MDREKIKNELHTQFPIDSSPILQSILENSRIAGIFIMDEKGTILRANPGALKYFGYTEKDVMGRNFSLLFTKEDKSFKSPEKELKSVLETGSGVDNNFIVHKNGSHIWCHGESILARDGSGKIYIVKIVFDIDKQRRLEKELFKKNTDLSNFIYTTSHDLKAPINNIGSLIDVFTEHPEIAEEFGEEINMIKESIKKFKNILNDISEIGKVQEQGKDDVAEVKFNDLFDEIKWSLNDEIKNSKAILWHNFSDAPKICFSRKNLRSVFYNLLSNAIKFRSPERSPEIKISTEKVDNDWIVLKVEDNGLGIKEEDKRRVFALYGRLSPSVEGSGIGMAIVARIIDSHGGKIEIESEPGKGSIFKVYFKA